MDILVREYCVGDLRGMMEIWNGVVEEGVAFPQMETLDEKSAADFFGGQSFSGVAENLDTGEILGVYVLHPNNIGRCGHISNASYAVKDSARGMRVGEKMVRHCIEQGKLLGFKILQFNAVVKTNHSAIRLYEKLGFVRLGVIPAGFLMKDGMFEDIIVFYRPL